MLNPKQGPGAAFEQLVDHPGITDEYVETAVRREAQIDRSAEAGRKGLGRCRLGGVDALDPAVIEVAEEVLAAVFLRPAVVRRCKGPAGDTGRRVVVDRSSEARVRGRPMIDGRP